LPIRGAAELHASPDRLLPVLARAVAGHADADIAEAASQIGSGALPVDLLPSAALRLTPLAQKKRQGTALKRLADAFRNLPRPVIGRVHDGALLFDLRCLDDEAGFVAQLDRLALP
jgi:L-seryl-tRNA(Ser) seleniumtransferase